VVLTTREETKMPPRADLATFLYETSTDNAGFFSVAHELEIFEPDGFSIQGIVVAVQHVNGNWHTLEISNEIDNRFWWNDTLVQGLIASPNFHNRPVKVIVFAVFVVG
jgi:hypothetical protein